MVRVISEDKSTIFDSFELIWYLIVLDGVWVDYVFFTSLLRRVRPIWLLIFNWQGLFEWWVTGILTTFVWGFGIFLPNCRRMESPTCCWTTMRFEGPSGQQVVDSSKNRIVKQVQSWMVLATTLGNWTSYTVTTLLLHLAWRHRFTQNGECKSKVRNEEIWYSCCSREAQTLTSYLYIYKLH